MELLHLAPVLAGLNSPLAAEGEQLEPHSLWGHWLRECLQAGISRSRVAELDIPGLLWGLGWLGLHASDRQGV